MTKLVPTSLSPPLKGEVECNGAGVSQANLPMHEGPPDMSLIMITSCLSPKSQSLLICFRCPSWGRSLPTNSYRKGTDSQLLKARITNNTKRGQISLPAL